MPAPPRPRCGPFGHHQQQVGQATRQRASPVQASSVRKLPGHGISNTLARRWRWRGWKRFNNHGAGCGLLPDTRRAFFDANFRRGREPAHCSVRLAHGTVPDKKWLHTWRRRRIMPPDTSSAQARAGPAFGTARRVPEQSVLAKINMRSNFWQDEKYAVVGCNRQSGRHVAGLAFLFPLVCARTGTAQQHQ